MVLVLNNSGVKLYCCLTKLSSKSYLVYNLIMTDFHAAFDVLLKDAIRRDRATARRAALLKILQHERYLTREQLIVRVEDKLGKGCFGASAWKDSFYRDMQVVKRALTAAGHELAYSRSRKRPGYYLRGEPLVSAELSSILKGCVAQVDPAQIAILKRLTPAQRFRMGCEITDLAVSVVAHRIRLRNPELSLLEA